MTRHYVWLWTLAMLAAPLARAEEDYLPSGPLHDAGLVKYWQLQLPLEPDQFLRDAYLVEDTLYFGTQDGYAWAVDAQTGVIRWLQPVTRSGYHVRRPCHLGERVLFVTPTDIQAYDRRTGEGLARREFRFPAGTGPVTDGERVFIGGLDARLHAIDAGTLLPSWRVTMGAAVASAPVIGNLPGFDDPNAAEIRERGSLVYAVDSAGNIYATTRGRKAFVWQAATFGPVTADLVVDERGVYVASRDQSLYLFDLNFGQVRWRARFASPLYEPPFVTPDLVYQYSAAEGVVAVETGLPHEEPERNRWTLAAGRFVLCADERLVYVLSGDGQLLVVRQKDGAVTHAIPAAGFTLGIPAEGVALFLTAPDGRVFCGRALGVPFLRQEDVLNALRPPAAATQPAAPATQPSAQPGEPDFLRTQRGGAPIGGKSKVSKEFRGGERRE